MEYRTEEEMLYNLKAEMARKNIKHEDIRNVLGLSQRAIGNRMQGKVAFKLPEAQIIRDTFFPDLEIEYLFESDKE